VIPHTRHRMILSVTLSCQGNTDVQTRTRKRPEHVFESTFRRQNSHVPTQEVTLAPAAPLPCSWQLRAAHLVTPLALQ